MTGYMGFHSSQALLLDAQAVMSEVVQLLPQLRGVCAACFREIHQLCSRRPGDSAGVLRPSHNQFG